MYMNASLLVSLIPDIIAIIRTWTRKPTPPAGSAVVGTGSWKSASHDVGAKSVRHLWSWAGGNIPSKSQWHIQWLRDTLWNDASFRAQKSIGIKTGVWKGFLHVFLWMSSTRNTHRALRAALSIKPSLPSRPRGSRPWQLMTCHCSLKVSWPMCNIWRIYKNLLCYMQLITSCIPSLCFFNNRFQML